jgi:hypothetical protein
MPNSGEFSTTPKDFDLRAPELADRTGARAIT